LSLKIHSRLSLSETEKIGHGPKHALGFAIMNDVTLSVIPVNTLIATVEPELLMTLVSTIAIEFTEGENSPCAITLRVGLEGMADPLIAESSASFSVCRRGGDHLSS
jgi:hypothetical protein